MFCAAKISGECLQDHWSSGLPLHSKFFSMQDWPSFGYLVYITHGVDYSSVYLSERL